MKKDFENFADLLQNKQFDSAASYVSVEYIDAMYSSRNQMRDLLKSNFDDWVSMPGFTVDVASYTVTKPETIISTNEKHYGVVAAVFNMELSINGSSKKNAEEYSAFVKMMEALSNGRFKFGKIRESGDGKTTIPLQDHRLIAAICSDKSKKCQFAMAEMGMEHTFQKFLPDAIVVALKTQF